MRARADSRANGTDDGINLKYFQVANNGLRDQISRKGICDVRMRTRCAGPSSRASGSGDGINSLKQALVANSGSGDGSRGRPGREQALATGFVLLNPCARNV